ncbi:MAG: GTP pyrophosphokinase, partial [Spirochaetota bacterium]
MITGDLEQGNQEQLKRWYEQHGKQLHDALLRTQEELGRLCARHELQPTIKYRVKGFESITSKLRKRKHSEQSVTYEKHVLPCPADLLGMRIVCPFIEDIRHCERIIEQHYAVVEREQKGAQYSFHEFGYESIHYLVRLPEDVLESCSLDPGFVCEIQLRTILQDAWAEVEHELVYKADFSPFDEPLRRKLAALNANLSLADIVFQEIRDYQRQLNHQMQRRRDSFAETVERLVAPEEAGAG